MSHLLVGAADPRIVADNLGFVLGAIACVVVVVFALSSIFLILASIICGVKPPSFIGGVGITIVTVLTGAMASFVIGVAVGVFVQQSGGGEQKLKAVQLPVAVFNLAVQTIITSLWYGVFLKVDALKGFLVLVVQSIFFALLGAAVALLLVARDPDFIKNPPAQWQQVQPVTPADSPQSAP